MSRKDGEGVEVSLSQDFVYYKAHNGSDMQGQGQPAGAYIFRPTDDQARVSKPHIRGGIDPGATQGGLVDRRGPRTWFSPL